jgi:ATPase subunit of ABC transporter with duplicated ATPase domains
MAASITLSDLAWSTPEGRAVFSGLGLTFGPERTGLVGRNGVGKTTLLKMISGDLLPPAGKVAVAGRVATLRQTVQVESGQTVADLFGVTDALALLRRAEAGEASLDELDTIDWSLEARVTSALDRLGLDAPPGTLLATLSGGQRTRAGLAALVFAEPDFLLLDEPTNNLDRDGRAAVIDLLRGWRSGAVVVSHDRELLDAVDAIVELTSLGATRYGGNWSAYREQKAVELGAAERLLADAEKRVAAVDRAAQDRAERQSRRTGAGRREGLKGGTPRILLGGRKDRAEDTTGGNARLAERHREDAQTAAASARERIEILKPLNIKLPPTHLPAGKVVLKVDAVTAGYQRNRPVLRDLSVTITGPERVAVTGPNGSGKTTLLALATGRLPPWAGAVQVMTAFAVLDQRVSLLDPAASVLDNFRRINPLGNEPACRSALAKFLFRADAALQAVSTLSGGQLLRAGLACVLGGPTPPPLLILDEPTNHLDIDSVEAVEAGLRAFDGAMLVVSHDESFLRAVGISRRIEL